MALADQANNVVGPVHNQREHVKDVAAENAHVEGRGVRHGGLFQTSEGWTHLLRTTAQYFTIYNIYVNRVGFEDGAHFPGGSMVVSPAGEIVAQAKYFEEDFVVTEIDLEEVRRARLFAPMLRDERLELTLRELTRIINKRNAAR